MSPAMIVIGILAIIAVAVMSYLFRKELFSSGMNNIDTLSDEDKVQPQIRLENNESLRKRVIVPATLAAFFIICIIGFVLYIFSQINSDNSTDRSISPEYIAIIGVLLILAFISIKVCFKRLYAQTIQQIQKKDDEEIGCFIQAVLWVIFFSILFVVKGVLKNGFAFFSSIDIDAVLYFVLFLYAVAWIWGLVDCLKHEKEQQIVWVLLFIFVPILGAILYFCMRFERNRESQ